MDYGQTAQSNSPEFFTSGAGTNNEEVNTFDAKDNLDLTNNQVNWSQPIERDNRSIGSKAFNSSEADQPQGDFRSEQKGEVINLEMPPQINPDILAQAPNQPNPDLTTVDTPDINLIRAEKDNISPQTLEATEQAVENFQKGKIGPADLDDLRWEYTKAYLKNSFGREVA